jgi:hypothetical protein
LQRLYIPHSVCPSDFVHELILETDDEVIEDIRDDMTTVIEKSKDKKTEGVGEALSEQASESESSAANEELPTGPWEDLVVNNSYEINTEYPYRIRNKSNNRLIKEYGLHSGYLGINIGGKLTLKHIIIAKQWLPNLSDYKQIDHKNRDTTDNHLSNLRWVSSSENCMNRGSCKGCKYEYVSTLPEGSIEVKQCNGWQFTGKLFYHEGMFFSKVGDAYRKLIQLGTKNCKHVHVKDNSGKHRALAVNIFNRELACGALFLGN